MPQIKNLLTNEVFTVAKPAVWSNGVWECGDRRFTDPGATEYSPLPFYALLAPIDFYLAFTLQERMAIKASTLPVVMEFWDTYQRCERAGKPINPNSPAVQQGLAYLTAATTATPPGAGILAAGRTAQILIGAAQ